MTVDISRLQDRLQADDLHLLFAAESGSRAWGFHSPDSDYDVRFVFASKANRYLTIAGPLQTMRYDEDDKYDYVGWDIRKTLGLAQNSNPALLEWLRSTIVYADDYDFQDKLSDIMYEHFSPRRLVYHYVNFAANTKGYINKVFDGDYTCKQYLYALRPILCVMWMTECPGRMPPVRLLDILMSMTLPHELKGEMKRLLKMKSHVYEKHPYRSNYLNEFITNWFRDNENITVQFDAREVPPGLLDDLFAETVMRLK